MRGGVQLWSLSLAVALWAVAVWAHRCDRTPDGQVSSRVPADGRFVLRVNGAPDTYVPGGEYTISLSGQRNQGQVQQKFTGFTLVVESQYKGPLRALSPRDIMPRPVGAFHLQGDTLTKFSPDCINMVTHTSSMPKPDISVRWTAPPPGSGCVIFRATVVEHRDVWYQDDGPLSRVLCEQEQESLDTQPDILDQCCACDEAKYEVTFEGLWSRHTHPKDFPSNSWLTRFSDVIGASHSTNYRFWEYGGFSSDGLAQVAEHGSTRLLESELKSQSQHIRTIIKARGISYPNVTGKTFAVFRVDKVHHLMSLVSMIDPSPDWIVGVSALELCMANCSWADSKVLNLYPWDAGTDSGLSYISPDQNTDPREKIRRITTSFPNDPRSPFYDASGVEMKPLAKLYLTRQRLYEKTCEEETIPKSNDVCATTEWSDWGECSATCGRGNRHRQRHYLRPQNSRFCHERLSISQPCNVGHCMPTLHSHVTIEPINPECEVTEWGDWSRCKPTDAACTRGSQQRYRQVHARSRKKYCVSVAKLDQRECTPSSSPSVCPTIPTGSKPKGQDQDKDYGTEPNETEEAENGDGDNTDPNEDNTDPNEDNETVDAEEEEGRENEEDYNNGDGNNGLDNQGGGEGDEKSGENEVTEPSGECAMSQWSEWSPCDPRCGPGTSSRERAPLHLSGRRRRRRETTDADYGDYGVESVPESEDVEFGPEPCSAYPVLQRVACNGTDPSCEISTDQAQEVCALTAHPGLCPGPMVMRWHYDPALEDCREFQWTGCRGNLNRFFTLDACRKACESFTVELKAQQVEKLQKYGVSISGIMSYEIQLFEKCTANVTEEDELTTTEETTTEDKDMIGRSQIRGQLRLGEEAMEGTEKPVRHCKFSRWSEWSECDAPCGKQGVKERTRRIEVHARNGGKACNGKTRKQKKCIRRCKPDEDDDKSAEGNADCEYSEWSQWSECTATCGYSAIRQRTRRVLRGNAAECNDRLRKQHCNVGLCR